MTTTATSLRGSEDYRGTWVRLSPGGPLPELTGRVGVVGDPAGVVDVTARLVGGPELVKVFYPDPVWVLPMDAHGPVRESGRRHIDDHITDKWLRRQLTPHHQSDDGTAVRNDRFLAALGHPSCELVTWPVAGISEQGVRTGDGLDHHVDTLILVEG